MENTYTVVEWPEVQFLMDYEWFRTECHLINDNHGITEFGSSAYFVPLSRYNEVHKLYHVELFGTTHDSIEDITAAELQARRELNNTFTQKVTLEPCKNCQWLSKCEGENQCILEQCDQQIQYNVIVHSYGSHTLYKYDNLDKAVEHADKYGEDNGFACMVTNDNTVSVTLRSGRVYYTTNLNSIVYPYDDIILLTNCKVICNSFMDYMDEYYDSIQKEQDAIRAKEEECYDQNYYDDDELQEQTNILSDL